MALTQLLLSIIYTIGSLLLYSVLTCIVLLIFYYPTRFFFRKFIKKINWTFSAFLSSYIFVLIGVIVLYFMPHWFFGWPFSGYENAVNKTGAIFYLIAQFLLYALFLNLIAQLFIFLGDYLKEKFKFKSNFLKVLVSIFIVSVILNIIIIIFPWILGGILEWIWF